MRDKRDEKKDNEENEKRRLSKLSLSIEVTRDCESKSTLPLSQTINQHRDCQLEPVIRYIEIETVNRRFHYNVYDTLYQNRCLIYQS